MKDKIKKQIQFIKLIQIKKWILWKKYKGLMLNIKEEEQKLRKTERENSAPNHHYRIKR